MPSHSDISIVEQLEEFWNDRVNCKISVPQIMDVAALDWISANFDEHVSHLLDGDKVDGIRTKIQRLVGAVEDGSYESEYQASRWSHGSGRLYEKGGFGIQGLPKVIRHTLCHDLYWDLDMVNAHPVILRHLCRELSLEVPALDKYLLDRESVLKSIVKLNPSLTRDSAKTTILSMINQGSKHTKLKSTWLKRFSKELRVFYKAYLAAHPEDLATAVNDIASKKASGNNQGGTNPRARAVNMRLCDEENKMVLAMLGSLSEEFGDENVKPFVLCFDGIMLPKLLDLTPEVIEDAENAMFEATCIQMKLKIKPMDGGIEYERLVVGSHLSLNPKFLESDEESDVESVEFEKKDEDDEIEPPLEDLVSAAFGTAAKYNYRGCMDKLCSIKNPTIADVIKYMADTIRINRFLGSWVYVREPAQVDLCMMGVSASEWHKESFSAYCKSLEVDINIPRKGKKVQLLGPLVRGFLRQRKPMVTIGRPEFYPYLHESPVPENVMNTFTGFPMKEWDDGPWREVDVKSSKMYIHLRDYMCAGNPVLFKYLIGWLADMIQNPGKVPGTALMFISKAGAGKDLLAEFCSYILGAQYFTSYEQSEEFYNKFNAKKENKLMIVVNEMSASDKAHSDVLKAQITQKRIDIQHKGSNTYSVKHCSRYLMFTNNYNSLYLEGGDRRYCLFDCVSVQGEFRPYFNGLRAQYRTPTHIKAWFEFLANYSLGTESWQVPGAKFSVRDFPNTELRAKRMNKNMPNAYKFLIERTESQMEAYAEGEPTFDCEFLDGGEKSYSGEFFHRVRAYDLYVVWCSRSGERAVKKDTFLEKLEQLGIPLNKRHYVGGKRKRGVAIIPSQLEMLIRKWLGQDSFSLELPEE